MKRLKTVLCAVLVAVLGLICLTACGKTGTYKFSYMKMTQGATSIEIRAGESYMGLTLSEEAFVMDLREDGTASISMDMFGETLSEEGTWTENAEDKSKVDITFNGETVTAECSGSAILFSMDGMEFELKK